MKCILVISLLIASPAYADVQRTADVISYGTVFTQTILNTIHSAKQKDKKKAFTKQGLKLGAVVALSETVKHFVHVERPDGSDNKSFWSEHSAVSAVNHGWNYKYGVILDWSTMTGRVTAEKHRIVDVLTGFLVGSLIDKAIK